MTLLLTTLPEERAELAKTLERYLISPDLDDLVGELTALHGASPSSISVGELLDDDRGNVLLQGLTALPAEKLRYLLRYPTLLIELHELVLIEGGPYWDQCLQQQPEVQAIVQRVGQRLQVSLGLQKAPTPASQDRGNRFYARPWFVSLATAAVVLVGVYFGHRYWESQQVWGWNQPNLLVKATTAKELFLALANAGNEFPQHVKDSPESLDQALREMKEGCIRLRSARYPQLSQKDRDWLEAMCKKWGEKLDQHLVDLRSGTKDWQTVRDEANKTIETSVITLRERAV